MLGYKLEKLEMCSRELELIISETKKKVTKYGRNKITVDIGGLWLRFCEYQNANQLNMPHFLGFEY